MRLRGDSNLPKVTQETSSRGRLEAAQARPVGAEQKAQILELDSLSLTTDLLTV